VRAANAVPRELAKIAIRRRGAIAVVGAYVIEPNPTRARMRCEHHCEGQIGLETAKRDTDVFDYWTMMLHNATACIMCLMLIIHMVGVRASRCYETEDRVMGRRMVAKLASAVQRLNLIAPVDWLKRIDAWRRHQPNLPTRSEAIRRLVELGLDAAAKQAKPKS